MTDFYDLCSSKKYKKKTSIASYIESFKATPCKNHQGMFKIRCPCEKDNHTKLFKCVSQMKEKSWNFTNIHELLIYFKDELNDPNLYLNNPSCMLSFDKEQFLGLKEYKNKDFPTKILCMLYCNLDSILIDKKKSFYIDPDNKNYKCNSINDILKLIKNNFTINQIKQNMIDKFVYGKICSRQLYALNQFFDAFQLYQILSEDGDHKFYTDEIDLLKLKCIRNLTSNISIVKI